MTNSPELGFTSTLHSSARLGPHPFGIVAQLCLFVPTTFIARTTPRSVHSSDHSFIAWRAVTNGTTPRQNFRLLGNFVPSHDLAFLRGYIRPSCAHGSTWPLAEHMNGGTSRTAHVLRGSTR